MAEASVLTINAEDLVNAWQDTLPDLIKPSGECTIQADAKFKDTLLIHIADDGRTHYSFDFRCRYVDDREVKVEVVDVEKANESVDEQSDSIQALTERYVRNIHECAQRLQGLTKQ